MSLESIIHIIDILAYCSIGICCLGVIFAIDYTIRIYFSVLFLIEIFSFYIPSYNLEFISISYTLHLLFISHLFLKNFRFAKRHTRQKIWLTVSCSLILLIVISCLGNDPFHWGIRAGANLIIVTYSLSYFVRIYSRLGNGNQFFLINASIFLFFGLDLFLVVTLDFLFVENLSLIAGFWFFRALLLQIYYISLIYYGRAASAMIMAS